MGFGWFAIGVVDFGLVCVVLCCFKFAFCSFVYVSSVVLWLGLIVAWLLLMVTFSGFVWVVAACVVVGCLVLV